MSSWGRAVAVKKKAVAPEVFRGLSIIYITFREHCKFEWFIHPLIRQTAQYDRSKMEVIVVDGFLDNTNQAERRAFFEHEVNNSFRLKHVSPKPTQWQGPHRLTPENYFAAANTRNTGACYASYPSLVFVDDLGCIADTWFKAVYDASIADEINCGAYTKVSDIQIDENYRFAGGDTKGGVDARLGLYNKSKSTCSGSQLYGSSFTIPKAAFFSVNGQNEMCDGGGAEDYDFGLRLERAGHRFYYNKEMMIHESNTAFGSDTTRRCHRADPVLERGDYLKVHAAANLPVLPTERNDMSHFMLSMVTHGPIQVNPEFNLEVYNRRILNNMDPEFALPVSGRVHFFTGRPIEEGI